jgi:predicted ferric reductase
LIAFYFILAHPLILFVVNPAYLSFLDPRANLPRAFALTAVLGALILLVVTTLWRKPVGLSYEWWRAGHGLLALFVMFVGLVHILQVGFYVSEPWKQALWVVMTVGAMLLLIKTRVIRPLQLRRRPYIVKEIRRERGRSWTMAISPDGHSGMTFTAGQFVWLTLGNSPFSLQQHPFSISSSALRNDRIELTIKELGDFTATIKDVKIDSCAFAEGPFGAFTLDPSSAKGAFFIVGGVGITPVMSMLQTLRDLKDRRPLVLIYANNDWENVLFREEINHLSQDLNFRLIHVLLDPPQDWTGESGLISSETIDRALPQDPTDFDYYICGPEPLMDLAEMYLLERGIPMKQIFSERFNIV